MYVCMHVCICRERERELHKGTVGSHAILPRTFQVPCKFHHVGSGCGKKDCLFKHAALTDEEREWAERFILKSGLYSGFSCSKCTRALTSENVWEWVFFIFEKAVAVGLQGAHGFGRTGAFSKAVVVKPL